MEHFYVKDNNARITVQMQMLIEQEIKDGYVSCRKHPDFDYYILNYTNKCQMDWRWTEATKLCRGLIVDGQYNLIARSYYKFFTLDQIEDSQCDAMPSKVLDYTIAPKKDGFLGILYFSPDGKEAFVSTRGSFESEMAIEATKMLRNKYASLVDELDRNFSYVFEIIYPNDLLTIVYKDSKLVMHGVFDNRTGEEISVKEFNAEWYSREDSFEIEYPVEEGTAWKGLEDFYSKFSYDYDEGYVITFSDFSRVKVKFDEYKQMTRAKSSLGSPGSKRFWVNLSTGKIEEVLDLNPLIATSIMGASVAKYKKVFASRLETAQLWLDTYMASTPDATIRDLGMYFAKVKMKDSGVIISLFLKDGKAEEKVWKLLIKESKNVSEEE
jgi:hypothetical protein